MDPPKVFISYSWDSEEHKNWVRELAARLTKDGVKVTLDQWHLSPGDQLPVFMERSLRDNDFILMICTPGYKHRADNRIGGVGYEGDIFTGEVLARQNHRKFVPLFRTGTEWIGNRSAPLYDWRSERAG